MPMRTAAAIGIDEIRITQRLHACQRHMSMHHSADIAHVAIRQTFTYNIQGRDFAVGDVHGHFSALHEGLETIGFNPNCDRLFALGDLVDRGPESTQVGNWLEQPWFYSVQGNHEAMACAAISGNDEHREVERDPHADPSGKWRGVSWPSSTSA